MNNEGSIISVKNKHHNINNVMDKLENKAFDIYKAQNNVIKRIQTISSNY